MRFTFIDSLDMAVWREFCNILMIPLTPMYTVMHLGEENNFIIPSMGTYSVPALCLGLYQALEEQKQTRDQTRLI